MKAFVALNQKLKTQIETILDPIQAASKALLLAFEDLQISATLFPHESLPKLLTLLADGQWPKEMLNTTLSKGLETGTFLKKKRHGSAARHIWQHSRQSDSTSGNIHTILAPASFIKLTPQECGSPVAHTTHWPGSIGLTR
jgi:hypothetical protein